MKQLIATGLIVLGLTGMANVASAVERETVELGEGYAIIGFVAHSPAERVQAERAARGWEMRRHLGFSPVHVMAVAVDDEPGMPDVVLPLDSPATAQVSTRSH